MTPREELIALDRDSLEQQVIHLEQKLESAQFERDQERARAEKAEERLKRLDAYDEPNEQVQGFILDVLEHLERLGVDTTNWDGDESSATILARCVAGRIREESERAEKAEAACAYYVDLIQGWIRDVVDDPHEPIIRDDVGKGWMSPEKRKLAVEALQLFVDWCKTPEHAPTPELIEAQHDALDLLLKEAK